MHESPEEKHLTKAGPVSLCTNVLMLSRNDRRVPGFSWRIGGFLKCESMDLLIVVMFGRGSLLYRESYS